ncbi:hypothetical protein D3C77_643280 [compost metagenome]
MTFGIRISNIVPTTMQKHENIRLRIGMAVVRESILNCPWACFSIDKPYSMRVLE